MPSSEASSQTALDNIPIACVRAAEMRSWASSRVCANWAVCGGDEDDDDSDCSELGDRFRLGFAHSKYDRVSERWICDGFVELKREKLAEATVAEEEESLATYFDVTYECYGDEPKTFVAFKTLTTLEEVVEILKGLSRDGDMTGWSVKEAREKFTGGVFEKTNDEGITVEVSPASPAGSFEGSLEDNRNLSPINSKAAKADLSLTTSTRLTKIDPESRTDFGKCSGDELKKFRANQIETLEQDKICRKCNRKFASKKSRIRHEVCHSSERPFACDLCGKTFKLRQAVYEHQRNIHPFKYFARRSVTVAEAAKPEIKEEDESISCHLCDQRLGDKKDYEDHMCDVHAGDRKEEGFKKCPICSKSCKSPGLMKLHMRESHSDPFARFECQFCGQKFKKRTLMNQHVAYRHKEKEVECPNCDKKYATVYDLKRHMVHHDESLKPKCSICERVFTTKVNLKKHEEKYHVKTDASVRKSRAPIAGVSKGKAVKSLKKRRKKMATAAGAVGAPNAKSETTDGESVSSTLSKTLTMTTCGETLATSVKMLTTDVETPITSSATPVISAASLTSRASSMSLDELTPVAELELVAESEDGTSVTLALQAVGTAVLPVSNKSQSLEPASTSLSTFHQLTKVVPENFANQRLHFSSVGNPTTLLLTPSASNSAKLGNLTHVQLQEASFGQVITTIALPATPPPIASEIQDVVCSNQFSF